MSQVFCERAWDPGQPEGMQVLWPRISEMCPGLFQATLPREHVQEFRGGTDAVNISSHTLHVKIFSYPKSWPKLLRNMIIESNPGIKKRNHVPFCSVLSDLPKINKCS